MEFLWTFIVFLNFRAFRCCLFTSSQKSLALLPITGFINCFINDIVLYTPLRILAATKSAIFLIIIFHFLITDYCLRDNCPNYRIYTHSYCFAWISPYRFSGLFDPRRFSNVTSINKKSKFYLYWKINRNFCFTNVILDLPTWRAIYSDFWCRNFANFRISKNPTAIFYEMLKISSVFRNRQG